MASTTTITAAKALEILGMSVVSGSINGSGHLILTRDNGSTIDAGDFLSIVTDVMDDAVAAQVAAQTPALITTAVANKVSGTVFAKGDQSGDLSFSGITNETLVNATITCKAVGNLNIDVADFPASPKAGTQFVVKILQDATGGRTLTLVGGIKKSQGVLTLSTGANKIDLISFFYDGTTWYAGAMGLDFS